MVSGYPLHRAWSVTRLGKMDTYPVLHVAIFFQLYLLKLSDSQLIDHHNFEALGDMLNALGDIGGVASSCEMTCRKCR